MQVIVVAYLTPLFPDNDEDRVPEVPDLAQVEDVEHLPHRGVDNVKLLARHDGIPSTVGNEASLDGHIGTKHHLGDVVEELQGVRVDLGDEGELEDGRADDDKGDVYDGDEGCGAEIGEKGLRSE